MSAAEALPPPDDDYWDDVTVDTLRLVRDLRAAHRRERTRAVVYTAYVTLLVALVYVVPYLLSALRAPDPGEVVQPAAAFVPPGVLGVVLLVVVALVRDALWRGPALLDVATADWLLPTPIRRGPLLRPRLRRSLLVGGVAGAGLGAVAGVMLRLLVGGGAGPAAALGATAGLDTLVLGIGLAGLVESSTGRPRRVLRRIGGWLWAVPALGAAAATALPASLAGGGSGAAVTVPTLVGGALLALLAAVAADRRIAQVPSRVLRARAASVTDVAQSLGTLQPRRARLLVELAQGREPRAWVRLPVPRTPALLWAWRDAMTLLRTPSRLLWGVVWIVTAALLSVAAAPVPPDASRGAEGFTLLLGSLVAGYLGASQLVEPARLDADDPRLVRSLPLAPGRLALRHLVTPLLVFAGVLLVTGAVLAVTGPAGGVAALAGSALAAPALVGAALVSAYRGDVPPAMLVGVSTPVGDTGPVQAVFWYLRGPLVGIGLLTPTALDGAALPFAVLAGTVMIRWATTRAATVLGGGAPR